VGHHPIQGRLTSQKGYRIADELSGSGPQVAT
jgi:hypothetical protein